MSIVREPDYLSSATDSVTEANSAAVKAAVETIDNFISGSRGLVTEDNSASIKTAVETIDNFISGSRGLVTEDNSAAIKTAVETIDNFISGARGLVTEDNSSAIKTAVETIDNFISGSRGLVTEDNSAAIKTSVEIMDDWDESDRAKVNPIVGQAGVASNVGSADALTQRVVTAAGTASTNNSTTTPLTGSATFTGTWEDITNYDFIEVSLYTDVDSATNGGKIQLSTDGGTTAERTLQNTITGGLGAYSYIIPVTAFTHFRIVYTNGSSGQAVFHLRAVKQSGPPPVPFAPIGAAIDATYSASLTRAVLAGQLPSGAINNLAIDSSGRPKVTINNFDVDTPIKALTSIKNYQKTIATTATQVDSSPLSGRKTISVKLISSATQKVYIGSDNTVTTSTGYELNAGDSVDMEVDTTQAIWAIADTSSQTITVLEIA